MPVLDLMILMSGPSYAGTKRLMIFIDGGYLRNGLTEVFGTDDLKYNGLPLRFLEHVTNPLLLYEVIRTYY